MFSNILFPSQLIYNQNRNRSNSINSSFGAFQGIHPQTASNPLVDSRHYDALNRVSRTVDWSAIGPVTDNSFQYESTSISPSYLNNNHEFHISDELNSFFENTLNAPTNTYAPLSQHDFVSSHVEGLKFGQVEYDFTHFQGFHLNMPSENQKSEIQQPYFSPIQNQATQAVNNPFQHNCESNGHLFLAPKLSLPNEDEVLVPSHDKGTPPQVSNFVSQQETNTRKDNLLTGNSPVKNSTLGRPAKRQRPKVLKPKVDLNKIGKPDPLKTFICRVCDRGFKRSEHLERHNRIHTELKPFECKLCFKRTARTDNLLQHLRSHPGVEISSTKEAINLGLAQSYL